MRCLFDRELLGVAASRRAAGAILSTRLTFLAPSRNVELEAHPRQRGPVTCLDVERRDERLLVTGGLDASVCLWDLEQRASPEAATWAGTEAATHAALASGQRPPGDAPPPPPPPGPRVVKPLVRIGKSRKDDFFAPHAVAVSSVQWYSIDSGAFVSGGMDGLVKLWDAEAAAVVCSIKVGAHVYAARMPSLALSHCLVAVGGDQSDVKLVDLRARAASHTLVGHASAVWDVAWSPSCEWTLATGGADHGVRLWDIRRANACVATLDQHGTGADGDCGSGARNSWGGGGDYFKVVSARGSAGGAAKRRASPAVAGCSSAKAAKLKTASSSTFAWRDDAEARGVTSHNSAVNGVVFAPSGQHLVTSCAGAGEGGSLRVWSVGGAAPPALCHAVHFSGGSSDRMHGPCGIAVLQPQRHAWARGGGGFEAAFEVALPLSPEPHVAIFRADPTAPAGTEAASGGGLPAQLLRGHLEPAAAACFRPSVAQLVTCGTDGLVLVWEKDAAEAGRHREALAAGERRRADRHAAMASAIQAPTAPGNAAVAVAAAAASAFAASESSAGGFLEDGLGDAWSDDSDDGGQDGDQRVREQLSPRQAQPGRGRGRRRNHNSHA